MRPAGLRQRRWAAALVAGVCVLTSCTIEQDLTPRIDALADGTAGDEVGDTEAGADDGGTEAPSDPDRAGIDDPAPSETPSDEPQEPSDPDDTDGTADGGTSSDGSDEPSETPGGRDDPGDGPTTDPDPDPGEDPSDEPSPVPGNRAPVAAADDVATNEDTKLRIDVLANDVDPDGDGLSLTRVGSPGNGVATLDGSRIAYSPVADFNGTDSFTYTVSDGRGGTDTATVDVTVRPVNDAPTATADGPYLAQQGSSLVLSDLLDDDTDVDGDDLAIAVVSNGANGGVKIVDDTTVAYTHNGGNSTSDSFTYRVSDGSALSAPATVTIAVNRRPIARDDAMVVVTGFGEETFTFNVITGTVIGGCCTGTTESWSGGKDSDPDGDPLEYVGPRSLRFIPTWMSGFQCNAAGTCQIRTKECAESETPWTFSYTIRDGRGGEDTATMSFRPDEQCIR